MSLRDLESDEKLILTTKSAELMVQKIVEAAYRVSTDARNLELSGFGDIGDNLAVSIEGLRMALYNFQISQHTARMSEIDTQSQFGWLRSLREFGNKYRKW